MNTSDADWSLFCENLPKWKEKYIQGIIDKYIQLLNDAAKSASDRFWELQDRVKHDENSPGAIMGTNQSEAVWNIICLVRENVISFDELLEFSDELQREVRRKVESRY